MISIQHEDNYIKGSTVSKVVKSIYLLMSIRKGAIIEGDNYKTRPILLTAQDFQAYLRANEIIYLLLSIRRILKTHVASTKKKTYSENHQMAVLMSIEAAEII